MEIDELNGDADSASSTFLGAGILFARSSLPAERNARKKLEETLWYPNLMTPPCCIRRGVMLLTHPAV